MPFSSKSGKEQIAQWFKENEPKINRILDIGAGSGTYPILIKQENMMCLTSQWIGIEAWEPYITKFKLSELYDTLIVEDIRKIDLASLGKFDVVIAGDVLEHMTKDEAVKLTTEILKNSGTMIISLPIAFMPQDAYEGNPYEIHVKPDWSHDEVLDTWGDKIKHFYRKGAKSKIGVYWLSND